MKSPLCLVLILFSVKEADFVSPVTWTSTQSWQMQGELVRSLSLGLSKSLCSCCFCPFGRASRAHFQQCCLLCSQCSVTAASPLPTSVIIAALKSEPLFVLMALPWLLNLGSERYLFLLHSKRKEISLGYSAP